jgi:pilus assembly protein CpaE
VNVVVVATEMTLASARDAIRILSWLKSNASHARPIVVANKVQPAISEISRADFEASIERKINLTVPYDLKAAANAAKLGQTFAEANRSSKAGSVIRELATAVIGVGEEGAGEAEGTGIAGRKSLLGKFDLKAMLPPKKK